MLEIPLTRQARALKVERRKDGSVAIVASGKEIATFTVEQQKDPVAGESLQFLLDLLENLGVESSSYSITFN